MRRIDLIRAAVGLLLTTGCGSVTLRYIPAQSSLAFASPAQCELTESTPEALLAEGWARIGWVYRHATRGDEHSGNDEMLAEAARRGGERMRIAFAERWREEVTGTVVTVNAMGGYQSSSASGSRGHIRRIADVWRRDPPLAEEQRAARADMKPDPWAQVRALCNEDDSHACHGLAQEHRRGQRIAYSNEWLVLEQRACTLGLADACLSVARNAFYDLRRPESRRDAMDSAVSGCSLGEPISCEIRDLFQAYDRGPDARTHGRATELGLHWCDEGDASACRFAARRFAGTAHGEYGPTDQSRADFLHRRAAELVDATRARDEEQMRVSCGEGVLYACYRVARSRDPDAAAVQVFDAACDAGIGEACLSSGEAYAEGRAVAVDRERALARRAEGCALGYAPSCSSLDAR